MSIEGVKNTRGKHKKGGRIMFLVVLKTSSKFLNLSEYAAEIKHNQTQKQDKEREIEREREREREI
jgi:hypothetical protein